MLTLAVFLGAALTFSTCTLAAPTGYNVSLHDPRALQSTQKQWLILNLTNKSLISVFPSTAFTIQTKSTVHLT
jgi:hypothetical protein